MNAPIIERSVPTKSPIESKTHRFNALVSILAVAQMAVDGGVVPPQVLPFIMFLVGAGNMILRQYFTYTKLK